MTLLAKMKRIGPLSIPAPCSTILVWLAYHAGKSDRCFPSIGTLAFESCLNPSTVRRALRGLEQLGLIHTAKRDHRSSIYILDLPPCTLQGSPLHSAGHNSKGNRKDNPRHPEKPPKDDQPQTTCTDCKQDLHWPWEGTLCMSCFTNMEGPTI